MVMSRSMGGKKPPEKNRMYEKKRRNKLNLQLEEINALLPEYDPSISVTKTEIFSRTIQYCRKVNNELENYKRNVDSLIEFSKILLKLLYELGTEIPEDIEFPEKLIEFKNVRKNTSTIEGNENGGTVSVSSGNSKEVTNQLSTETVKSNIIAITSTEKIPYCNIINLTDNKLYIPTSNIIQPPLSNNITQNNIQSSVLWIQPSVNKVSSTMKEIDNNCQNNKVIAPKPATERPEIQQETKNRLTKRKPAKGILVPFPKRKKKVKNSSISKVTQTSDNDILDFQSSVVVDQSDLQKNGCKTVNTTDSIIEIVNKSKKEISIVNQAGGDTNDNMVPGNELQLNSIASSGGSEVSADNLRIKDSCKKLSNFIDTNSSVKSVENGIKYVVQSEVNNDNINNNDFIDNVNKPGELKESRGLSTNDGILNRISHNMNNDASSYLLSCNMDDENNEEEDNTHSNDLNVKKINNNDCIGNVNKPVPVNDSESKEGRGLSTNDGILNRISHNKNNDAGSYLLSSNMDDESMAKEGSTHSNDLNVKKINNNDCNSYNYCHSNYDKENISMCEGSKGIIDRNNGIIPNNDCNGINFCPSNHDKENISTRDSSKGIIDRRNNRIIPNNDCNSNNFCHSNYDKQNTSIHVSNLDSLKSINDCDNNSRNSCNISNFQNLNNYRMVDQMQSEKMTNGNQSVSVEQPNLKSISENKTPADLYLLSSNKSNRNNKRNNAHSDDNSIVKDGNNDNINNANDNNNSDFCRIYYDKQPSENLSINMCPNDGSLKEISNLLSNNNVNNQNNKENIIIDTKMNNNATDNMINENIIHNDCDSNENNNLPYFEEFRLPFNNADFSNDLFSSLQMPSEQRSESISPTQAFLLNFPVVSTSKTNDLLSENDNDSMLHLDGIDTANDLFHMKSANDNNQKLDGNKVNKNIVPTNFDPKFSSEFNDIYVEERAKFRYNVSSEISTPCKPQKINKSTNVQISGGNKSANSISENLQQNLLSKDGGYVQFDLQTKMRPNSISSHDLTTYPYESIMQKHPSLLHDISTPYNSPSFSNYNILSNYNNASIPITSTNNFSESSTLNRLSKSIMTTSNNNNNNFNTWTPLTSSTVSDTLMNNSNFPDNSKKSKTSYNHILNENKLPESTSTIFSNPNFDNLLTTKDNSNLWMSIPNTSHVTASGTNANNIKPVPYVSNLPMNWIPTPDYCMIPSSTFSSPLQEFVPQNNNNLSAQLYNKAKDDKLNSTSTNRNNNYPSGNRNINTNQDNKNNKENQNKTGYSIANGDNIAWVDDDISAKNCRNTSSSISIPVKTDFNLSLINNNKSFNPDIIADSNFSAIQNINSSKSQYSSFMNTTNTYSWSPSKNTTVPAFQYLDHANLTPMSSSVVCTGYSLHSEATARPSIASKSLLSSQIISNSVDIVNNNRNKNNDEIGKDNSNSCNVINHSNNNESNNMNNIYNMIWNPVDSEKLSNEVVIGSGRISKLILPQNYSDNFLSVTKLVNKEYPAAMKASNDKQPDTLSSSLSTPPSDVMANATDIYKNIHVPTFPSRAKTIPNIDTYVANCDILPPPPLQSNYLNMSNYFIAGNKSDNNNSYQKKICPKKGKSNTKQINNNNNLTNNCKSKVYHNQGKRKQLNNITAVVSKIKNSGNKKNNDNNFKISNTKADSRIDLISGSSMNFNNNFTTDNFTNSSNNNSIILNNENDQNQFNNNLINNNNNNIYTTQGAYKPRNNYSAESLISSINNNQSNETIIDNNKHKINDITATKYPPNFNPNNFHHSYNKEQSYPNYQTPQNSFHHVIHNNYQRNDNSMRTVDNSYKNNALFVSYNMPTNSSSSQNTWKDAYGKFPVTLSCDKYNNTTKYINSNNGIYNITQTPSQFNPPSMINSISQNQNNNFDSLYKVGSENLLTPACSSGGVNPTTIVRPPASIISAVSFPQNSTILTNSTLNNNYNMGSVCTGSNNTGNTHSATSLANFNLRTIFPEIIDKQQHNQITANTHNTHYTDNSTF